MFIASPDFDRVYYMINPVILETDGSQVGDEGCLSVPGMMGTVERPSYIKIEALDLEGNKQVYEFSDFDARVICHEYDHLEGILYTDKATNIREAVYEEDEE
jgi:peptide deformylase